MNWISDQKEICIHTETQRDKKNWNIQKRAQENGKREEVVLPEPRMPGCPTGARIT